MRAKSLQSCLTLCETVDCTCQGPVSMGFSRQEYWSGLPFPSPGELLDPGVEPGSPSLQADSLPSELVGVILILTSQTCKEKKEECPALYWGKQLALYGIAVLLLLSQVIVKPVLMGHVMQ